MSTKTKIAKVAEVADQLSAYCSNYANTATWWKRYGQLVGDFTRALMDAPPPEKHLAAAQHAVVKE